MVVKKTGYFYCPHGIVKTPFSLPSTEKKNDVKRDMRPANDRARASMSIRRIDTGETNVYIYNWQKNIFIKF